MILGNTAPHPEKVPYPIIRPRVGTRVSITCLTRGIWGLDTHWGNGATYFCPGAEICKACKKGEPARYQGYVMGRGFDSGIVAIIHLTASAADYVDNISTGPMGLVGLKMWLERTGNADNSEVEAHPLGWDASTEEFPWDTFNELMYAVYRVNKKGQKQIEERK